MISEERKKYIEKLAKEMLEEFTDQEANYLNYMIEEKAREDWEAFIKDFVKEK